MCAGRGRGPCRSRRLTQSQRGRKGGREAHCGSIVACCSGEREIQIASRGCARGRPEGQSQCSPRAGPRPASQPRGQRRQGRRWRACWRCEREAEGYAGAAGKTRSETAILIPCIASGRVTPTKDRARRGRNTVLPRPASRHRDPGTVRVYFFSRSREPARRWSRRALDRASQRPVKSRISHDSSTPAPLVRET